MEIWHNPRCMKSRQALEFLLQNGVNPEIRLYLKDSPSKAELESVINKLNIRAENLIRKKEKEFIPYIILELSEAEVIELMTRLPVLIERPIIIKGDKAVIGRSIDNIAKLI